MWFQCNPGRTAKMPKHPAMPSTLRFKKCITSDLWSSFLEKKKAWKLHESLRLDRRSLFVGTTAHTKVVRPLRIHVISCLSEAPTNCLSSSFLPPPVDPTPLRRRRWTVEIADFYVEKCPFLVNPIQTVRFTPTTATRNFNWAIMGEATCGLYPIVHGMISHQFFLPQVINWWLQKFRCMI